MKQFEYMTPETVVKSYEDAKNRLHNSKRKA